MTETDWWAANGRRQWPDPLFHWLFYIGASDRKIRLSCVACCRPVERFAGAGPFLRLLPLIEDLADGRDEDRARDAITSAEAWHYERSRTLRERRDPVTLPEDLELEAESAILAAGGLFRDREWHQARKDYPYPCFVAEDVDRVFELLGQQAVAERHKVGVVHDIFGPLPFRDVAIAPGWRTSDVLALARGIYDEKAFDRLPILADALQDAGCDNDEILNHCRAANWEHVRGCWVLDLVLGRPWREEGGTPRGPG
jgi:hypothetical protein